MGTAAVDGNAPDTGQQSPMVSRMLVGAALRRLRETAGLSREEAGRAVDAPVSAISRMELGRIGCRLRDVIDLCALYGVTDQVERATLLGLVRQASRPEWWREYQDVIPGWFVHYLGLEQSASLIRSYELQLIPGLLQTADYARAVIELGHGAAPEREIERRVELRMRRQEVLRSARAPRVWTVIDEAALRRPIGGTATMRGQLRHLIRACDMPGVTISVLPFRLGGHAATGGAITMVRLPERQVPEVVYHEQLASAVYCDDPGECDYYRYVLDRLVLMAASAEPAQAILSEILQDMNVVRRPAARGTAPGKPPARSPFAGGQDRWEASA